MLAWLWMSNGFGLKTVTPFRIERFLIPGRPRHLGRLFFFQGKKYMADNLAWQPFGLITICNKGWPKFPEMPEAPGLYRITLNDGHTYIGEAGSLRRRLYEYRRPTPGIEQEHRVHGALVAAQGGKIDIYTEGDLSTRQARMKFESAAIKAVLDAGGTLINLDGHDNADNLKRKIEYLEEELDKAKHKLSELKRSCEK